MNYVQLFGKDTKYTSLKETSVCQLEDGFYKIGGNKVVSQIHMENITLENIEFINIYSRSGIVCKLSNATLQTLAAISQNRWINGDSVVLHMIEILGNINYSNIKLQIIGTGLQNLLVKKREEDYEQYVEDGLTKIKIPFTYEINCSNITNFEVELDGGSISDIYYYCIPEGEDVKISEISFLLQNYNHFKHTGNFLNQATFACQQKFNTNPNLYYYIFGNFCSLNMSKFPSVKTRISMEKEFTGKLVIFTRMYNQCDAEQNIRFYGVPSYMKTERTGVSSVLVLNRIEKSIFLEKLEEKFCPISRIDFNIGENVLQCERCNKNYNSEYLNKYQKHVNSYNQIFKCPYCRSCNKFVNCNLI